MILDFEKYQGTGNDFIMLNNMDGRYDWVTAEHVVRFCDRRFGIGGDGLIRINSVDQYDFELDYFNADGTKSFCGNGARCGLAFAHKLGICKEESSFLGCDGPHLGSVEGNLYSIKMKDVSSVQKIGQDFVLDTGSPHYVQLTDDLEKTNVVEKGRAIRYSPEFKAFGINVNFITKGKSNNITIRTYERGVEDETLSCGTGATACAIVYAEVNNLIGDVRVNVEVMGGELAISFTRIGDSNYTNVYLVGPAKMVFNGQLNLQNI